MPEGIRYWGDGDSAALYADIIQSAKDHPMREDIMDESGPGWGALVLSGGGDVGAFGAGVLCGWTDRGDRPRFRIVTGVSTGALISPFAFIGKKYDDAMRKAYTETTPDDIYEVRAMLDWLRFDSIADSRPLLKFAERIFSESLIAEVAAEHAKGRRLYVQTVNLDAQRPVIWDLGAIASLGTPESAKLFRQALVASASIPGVFPPQYVKVQADGNSFDEMHVDGGTASQMLMNNLPIDLEKLRKDLGNNDFFVGGRKPTVFVIRNGYVRPEWQGLDPRLFPIGGRAISTMIKSQAETELELMYYKARVVGLDYFLCYLPDDYERQVKEEFDQGEMNRMFARGYEMARSGNLWMTAPPRMKSALPVPATQAAGE
jgi:predicted acylesterase/phospholipase RssA